MRNFKLITAFSCFSILSYCLYAQVKTNSSGGLYLTASDFQHQKITYQVNHNDANNKIRVNEFFGSSTGYVMLNGEKHSFDKKKVYGYRDFQNRTYRFYKGETYLLLDTAGFYMYYQYKSEENVKGKELIKKDEYFFSTTPGSDLQLLTIGNLKSAFAANNSFHYKLDENFRSDQDLISYDSFQKVYKIKYLYGQSLNK
ncbi:MAG TPA: hypothetical protein VMT76_17770 [Puia sp.]|nr:hypothetical protein [Puia sp.]